MLGRLISTVIVAFIVTFFLCFGSFSAQCQEKKPSAAVVIAPFDITTAGKYSYLKDSLWNMLASRLTTRDGIQVMDYSLTQKELDEIKSSKKQELSQGLFARLHADYIATGALYSLANGLNVQITLFPSSAGSSPIKFTMLAENEEKILSSLDRLAQEIGDRVSGAAPGLQETEKAVAEDLHKQQTPVSTEGSAGFKTAHPDRLYKKGIYAGGTIVKGENSDAQVSAQGVRKSSPLSMQMVTMAVGDLDGDGIEEIALAADGELQIYHFQEGRFVQIAKAPISHKLKIHALNLADLDGSGKMKLYISATEESTISSLIASWDKEHGLQILHKNIHWYLRPLEVPGEGLVLAGQEKAVEENILVYPGIYQLTMEKGSNVPKRGKKISLPDPVNLFDFVLADLNGDGGVEKIVIDKNEKMLVYDQSNTLIWVSNDEFGGSTNFIGPNWRGLQTTISRIYVPTRIIAADVNNNKKQDIVIGRNKRDTYSLFSNLRSYNSGYVSCLTWTGSAMTELWHTNALPGMIADYSFLLGHTDKGTRPKGDSQAGGNAGSSKKAGTLFVGQIPDSSRYNFLVPAKSETNLFAYDLDFMVEDAKK